MPGRIMKLYKHILFLLLPVCPMLKAQTPAKTAQRYVLPFTLTPHNNMAVKGTVNGKDTVLLMFHTAASSVTLTEEAVQKCVGLRFSRTDTVGSWGGGENTSRYSEGNTLALGKQVWTNVPIWENLNSGPGTDGKFGMDLFAGQTLQIDFKKRELVVGGPLPDTKGFEKLELIPENDMFFVEAACEINGQRYTHRFLIHSGYAGTVLLNDQFAAEHRLAQKLTITSTQELKDSYGNVLKVQKGILPAFGIGQLRLADIPVGFFEGALGRQKISIVGGDFLKRFHWVFDAQRRYVYVRPNTA